MPSTQAAPKPDLFNYPLYMKIWLIVSGIFFMALQVFFPSEVFCFAFGKVREFLGLGPKRKVVVQEEIEIPEELTDGNVH